MKKRKTVVFSLTAICLFLISAVLFIEMNPHDDELTFLVQSGENFERIKSWTDGKGKVYIFLPSYAQLCDLSISVAKNKNVHIGDIPIENGMFCDLFQLDWEYELSGDLKLIKSADKIVFLQSANIPAVHIDTKSGRMDYIHREKGNEELCDIRVYTKEGNLNYQSELATIKGRGNSTWKADKKPYNIILDTEGNILEMGAAQKWVLLANALDQSNLSNKIAYDLAKEVQMKYSTDCTWVDLYLNGEYAGLYLLSEKVEVHANRVKISEENGFLLSAEAAITWYEKEEPKISTENTFLRIHHSAVTKNELQQIWQSAENAILSDNGIDSITGKHWQELIDLDSWVMRFLLDETMGNYDGGVQSQFYYGNVLEGKIYAGPVWDMDACLGKGVHPQQIMLYGQAGLGFSPYYKLFQKQAFHERAIELYRTVFLPLYEELLDTKFMQYVELISQSASMNQIRWKASDFNESVKMRYDFLNERIAFLNELWLTGKDFYKVYIVAKGSDWKTVDWEFAVPAGEVIPVSFDKYTDEWYNYKTNEKIDIASPIYENVEIWHEDAFTLHSILEDMDMKDFMLLRDTMKAAQNDTGKAISSLRIMPVILLFGFLLAMCAVEIVKRNDELKNGKNRK